MAMTGMRVVTVGAGLVRRPPPEEIAKEAVPALLRAVPPERRDAAIELAHWAYGAAAGAVFALLPAEVRRARVAGPAYGLVIWACFELGLAPLLGLRRPGERRLSERASIAADHVLYGAVLAGRAR